MTAGAVAAKVGGQTVIGSRGPGTRYDPENYRVVAVGPYLPQDGIELKMPARLSDLPAGTTALRVFYKYRSGWRAWPMEWCIPTDIDLSERQAVYDPPTGRGSPIGWINWRPINPPQINPVTVEPFGPEYYEGDQIADR